MSIQHRKVKSVAKTMMSRGDELDSKILDTLKICSDIVGSTLGPGGMSVIIERQEDLPPLVTKDGVTVFKNLGFVDATAQTILETVRDAAEKTAKEAGDGTTTATILSYSIVERTKEFCKKHPFISPQMVVRQLTSIFQDELEPYLKTLAVKPDFSTESGRKLLHAVAKVSGNGDTQLADAVIECFDIVGDEGNVTLLETSGPSGYRAERIDGYPVPIGYEDSCQKFFQKFINNNTNQSCSLDNPLFVLHFGQINSFNAIESILTEIARKNIKQDALDLGSKPSHNVVLVATKFSEEVLGELALNFPMQGTLNILPLLVPMTPVSTGQLDFLYDLKALTGAEIFDPISNPLPGLNDPIDLRMVGFGPSKFEATRYRSSVVGFRDPILIEERAKDIIVQLNSSSSSELDKSYAAERLGKITNGIARLIITAPSNGEGKERRDRAEDAICSVRGAVKHGALPAGGWGLLKLAKKLEDSENNGVPYEIKQQILIPALKHPLKRLYTNAGFTGETQAVDLVADFYENHLGDPPEIFDLMTGKYVNPFEEGLLDSLPAVLESLRNSLSIATQMGTCGGTVVYRRDDHLERQEAKDIMNFVKNLE